MNAVNRRTPKLKEIRQVSSGWINKYILTYSMPDGSEYEYESVSRKDLPSYEQELKKHGACPDAAMNCDAVCIVPILEDGSLLLIREFRYAINAWITAFPAGLLESGESIEECVERELFEETGYRLRKDVESPVSVLPKSGFSSAGMTDENVLVAKALVEPSEEAHLERGELIESFILPQSDIGRFLESDEGLIGTRCQLVLEGIRA